MSSLLWARPITASQADETTISIMSQGPGATPFLAQLILKASDSSVIKAVRFTVSPKPTSVTRPLSGTYARDYLIERGDLQPATNEIFLPIYGLYDAYENTVSLTYYFLDGSSAQDSVSISTPVFADPCGYKTPTKLLPRTKDKSLSYDFLMVKGSCGTFSPTILDTDGEVRWVGTAGISDITATFFDNAAYQAAGTSLFRIDLDGTTTLLHNYADAGVTFIHHNIDRGKTGVIIDVDTTAYTESVNMEVDSAGNILKTWNLADIISAAMVAGGDDPDDFIHPKPFDWFHNNGVAYNRADDSLVISSRQDFVICIDYKTSAIKWILGDPTKKWHEFPSLVKYALDLAPGSLPPIGQHAPSITHDQDVMVFDNGYGSLLFNPPGETRPYSSPRKYQIDLTNKVATEVWNYDMGQTVQSSICSSVYEDAPGNYLIDYSYVGPIAVGTHYAQLLGLNNAGEKVFYYQYAGTGCNEAFNSIPLHLEDTKFPAIGPQALNLSTRAQISSGDNSLIAGFIVTGSAAKTVALRVLGPSLSTSGVANTLADPVLTLHNSSGAVIASNDDWASDPRATDLVAAGLAPENAAEAATIQTLTPGAYTVVASGKGSGVGLVEAYDLSPGDASKLANLSTRGFVGKDSDALISGFIVGDVANATIAVRALGPSLGSAVAAPLGDPTLTVYDRDGVVIATNDNWQDDQNLLDIKSQGLAPTNPAESATILHPPAGAYTTIVRGADGGTGIGLVEIYDLD